MEHLLLEHKRTLVTALLSKTNITFNGHYLWNGGMNKDGYGVLWVEGKVYGVHRLSAYIYLGLDINNSTQHSLHKNSCSYKNCWNPEHLYVGNHKDNMNDLTNKLNSNSHFNCGHEKTKSNINHSHGREVCKTCYNKSDRKRRAKERARRKLKINPQLPIPLINPFVKTTEK